MCVVFSLLHFFIHLVETPSHTHTTIVCKDILAFTFSHRCIFFPPLPFKNIFKRCFLHLQWPCFSSLVLFFFYFLFFLLLSLLFFRCDLKTEQYFRVEHGWEFVRRSTCHVAAKTCSREVMRCAQTKKKRRRSVLPNMKLNFKKKTFRETKTVNAISLCHYSHQHTSLPSPHSRLYSIQRKKKRRDEVR